MKILLYSVMPVIPPDYGGAVRIYNIARRLSDMGIDTTVVSPKSAYTIDDKTQYGTNFLSYDTLILKLSKKISLISRMIYFINVFIFIKEFMLLKKIIDEKGTDKLILQSEFIYSTPPLYILKRIFHIPLVVTEHNVEAKLSFEINGNKLYNMLLSMIERLLLNGCDHIICVSDVDKSIIVNSYDIKADKITVIPNSVNTNGLNTNDRDIREIKKKYKLLDHHKIILFMGTLDYTPNKVAVEIIRSKIYPAIKVKVPEAKFIILGKGADPSIDGDIIFTGKVNDVSPYIKMCDVAICPLTKGSGTRLKILEYMAFCKPVVSTTKGAEGIDVINNENILLADDWDHFSCELCNIITNLELSKKIGDNARKLIDRKYSWNENIKKYVDIYNSLENIPNHI